MADKDIPFSVQISPFGGRDVSAESSSNDDTDARFVTIHQLNQSMAFEHAQIGANGEINSLRSIETGQDGKGTFVRENHDSLVTVELTPAQTAAFRKSVIRSTADRVWSAAEIGELDSQLNALDKSSPTLRGPSNK